MIWGILYFCLAFISNKYNIVYVNFPEYEGGGAHWVEVFNRILVGTFLYQLVLIGEFGIFKFVPGAIISGICAGATIVFGWYTHKQFNRSSRYLPIRFAMDLTEALDVSKADKEGKKSKKAKKADEIEADELETEKKTVEMDQTEKGEITHDDVITTHPHPFKEQTEVTNLNHTVFYYQPSLVPLVDEPEIDSQIPMASPPQKGFMEKAVDEERMEIRKSIDSGEGTV